mmetsp:Transcript_34081/g.90856  ORF Transcript_34081/g.90856 Transcript_34081/m.90856 type:complete len:153 (-) Transcript_34081:323-781(-)
MFGARRAASLLRATRPACRFTLVSHVPQHPVRPSFGAGLRCCSFSVNFVAPSGESMEVSAKEGMTILEVAHKHDIDIEGACGGECACSTCHVILEQEAFDAHGEPDEDEADMLDLAAHVTDTSRLGCCVRLEKARDENLVIRLPAGTTSALG